MLIIREQQMNALRQASRREFEDRTIQRLEVVFPDLVETTEDRAELRALVRSGIERGESYGLTTEHAITSFIDFMIMLDEDFDRNPEWPRFTEILRDEEIPPHEKIEWLRAQAEAIFTQSDGATDAEKA